jgi:hypothetical protein
MTSFHESLIGDCRYPILESFFDSRVGTTNLTPPFFFRAFAEDYPPFPHTTHEKGSAMEGIGTEKNSARRASRAQFSAYPHPPTLWKTALWPINWR